MRPMPVSCDRCGVDADVVWVDVSTMSEGPGSSYVMGRAVCVVPGCVDADGSPTILPPDVPGQLTRDDWRWLSQHERLIRDLSRAERILYTEGAR
jgi:hypothetical protein